MWFRQDLRLRDNPALHHAASEGDVLAVYILDDTAPESAQLGGASQWWLHHSLSALQQSLNDNLLIVKGNPVDILPKLANEYGCRQVVWNRGYEPWQIQRDTQVKAMLKDMELTVQSFNGNLLWEPWTVLKKDGTPYKVYTPYYRKGCLAQPAPRMPLPAPEQLHTLTPKQSAQLDDLGLIPEITWYTQMEAIWQPGEEGAARNLSRFLPDAVAVYKEERNLPAVTGTSLLSPHLHFGEMSPNQIWYAAIDSLNGQLDHPDLDCYLSELGWREFSHYLLFHWPTLPADNFNPKFNAFPWRNDPDALKAWQKGQTGIPIVDAGMRELWQTGYMHNRVRMIVGSFLVKNLLIDWREGERWFWDCLLDADMAANSASWQWVAGSGADAAPYFRIFNPVTQGEKFDPEGEYVKRYCPELSKMPPKFIHKPWEAPDNIRGYAGVALGHNYPKPLVDLKASRQRALDAFATIKGQTA